MVKISPISRTRVKVCGITNSDDLAVTVASGVDAVGLVFYPKSPRAVSIETAKRLCHELPAFVSAVGLFVDQSADFIRVVLRDVPFRILQFHGSESGEFASQFGLPYLAVIKVGGDQTLAQKIREHPNAAGFLFDTFDPIEEGGTGKSFDWQQFDNSVKAPVLAGGLNADNVAAAIAQCAPFAVDVSSGVERSPGEKCPKKIAAFIQSCRQADLKRAI